MVTVRDNTSNVYGNLNQYLNGNTWEVKGVIHFLSKLITQPSLGTDYTP